MSLIDKKFEDAAQILTDADDEVLQAAGMMALMRLQTLRNRLKGINTGKSPLTALPSNTSSPSQDDCKGESPTTKGLPQTSGGFPFGSAPQQLAGISGQDFKAATVAPSQVTTVAPQTTFGVGLLTGEGLTQTSIPSTIFGDPKINTTTHRSIGSVLAASPSTNKTPPVNNVVTAASDPLLSTKTSSQPIHLKGITPNTSPSILSKPPSKPSGHLISSPSLGEAKPATEAKNSVLATYVRSEATNQAASKLYNEKKQSQPNVTQEPKVLDKYYQLLSSRKDNSLALAVGSSRTSVPTPAVKHTVTQVKIEDYTKSLQPITAFSENRVENKKIVHRPQLQAHLPTDDIDTDDRDYYNLGLGLGSQSYNFRYENHYRPQSYTFNNVVYNLSTTVNRRENTFNALQLRGPERNCFSQRFGGGGGCGCKAIQCADRRCGCNKQGISCGSSCLCSSRGSWCLNR